MILKSQNVSTKRGTINSLVYQKFIMMNILFVFDPFLNTDKISQSSFGPGDEVYLFPLTSMRSVTNALAEKINRTPAHIAEIIQTAHAVNLAADRLREKYIRFIAEIPHRVNVENKGLKEFFAIDEYATLWWF